MSHRKQPTCTASVVWIIILSQINLFTASSACGLPAAFPHAQCDQLVIGSETYANCSCLPGYELAGPTSVAVLRCSDNGSWDGVNPVCLEVSCPEPPVPPHSVLNGPRYAVYKAGSVVTYTCNAGYDAEGDTTSTCNGAGSWSEVSLYCRPPCPVESLQYQTSCFFIREDELLRWDFARLKCEETAGHSLAKIDTVGLQLFLRTELLSRTGSSNFWIGGKEARPWVWENSKQFPNFLPWAPGEPNNLGTEQCIHLSSYSDAYGNSHGFQWNDVNCGRTLNAICQFSSMCKIASLNTYSQYDYRSFCLVFIQLPRTWSSALSLCSNHGGWLMEVQDQGTQDFIVDTLNSDFAEAQWWIGAKVDDTVTERAWRWVDDDLVTVPGWAPGEPNSEQDTCMESPHDTSYMWNNQECVQGNHFICRYDIPHITCGDPGQPLHGQRTAANGTFNVDNEVEFECDDGYELQGSSTRRCLSNGKWSGEDATCKIISCSQPSPIPSAYITVVSSENGGVAILSCAEGYHAGGDDELIVCLHSALWSPTNFSCTENPGTTNEATTSMLSTDINTVNTESSVTTDFTSAPYPLMTTLLSTTSSGDKTTFNPWTTPTDVPTSIPEASTKLRTTQSQSTTFPAVSTSSHHHGQTDSTTFGVESTTSDVIRTSQLQTSDYVSSASDGTTSNLVSNAPVIFDKLTLVASLSLMAFFAVVLCVLLLMLFCYSKSSGNKIYPTKDPEMLDIMSRAFSEHSAMSEEVKPIRNEFTGTRSSSQQRASAGNLPGKGASSPGRRLESPSGNGKQNTTQRAWVA